MLTSTQIINEELYDLHQYDVIPFANPFGASVLHCGHPDCDVSFVPGDMKNGDNLTPKMLDKIRQARAKHLVDVFGISTRFETNQTGLPEPTALPKPPSSMHTTLHISFARAWAALSVERRQLLIFTWGISGADGPVVKEHIDAVRKEICKSGRGNVFNEYLEVDIILLFPSFLKVLREALELDGKDGDDVAIYEHKLEENQMAMKVAYELKALERVVEVDSVIDA
jgi:hypothetical protein